MPESVESQLDLDNHLWVLLQRARSVASRTRNLELAQYEMTIEQMAILHSILMSGGSATVDEIAAIVIRQKNSVTTLIDRMAKSGLVKKKKGKTDKKYRISVTPKALDIINKVPRKSIEMLFSKFEAKEKEEMVSLLDRIVNTGLALLGENYIPPFLTKAQINQNEK